MWGLKGGHPSHGRTTTWTFHELQRFYGGTGHRLPFILDEGSTYVLFISPVDDDSLVYWRWDSGPA